MSKDHQIKVNNALTIKALLRPSYFSEIPRGFAAIRASSER